MTDLYVIGIGPGSRGGITIDAAEAIKVSECIVGYTTYINIVKDMFEESFFADKEMIVTGMRGETERCRLALEKAESGIVTCVVCSGDPTVYGMAGLIFELAEAYKNVQVKVIPGVTAALSGSALSGAALGHDFSVISLSDLLTPWEKIELRLEAAAKSDMCISLYNPASRKRADYLKKACDILLRTLSEDTVCAAAYNIGREGEGMKVMTLKELADYEADMFTTVFIGNESTVEINGKMVTPRGYIEKYGK